MPKADRWADELEIYTSRLDYGVLREKWLAVAFQLPRCQSINVCKCTIALVDETESTLNHAQYLQYLPLSEALTIRIR